MVCNCPRPSNHALTALCALVPGQTVLFPGMKEVHWVPDPSRRLGAAHHTQCFY